MINCAGGMNFTADLDTPPSTFIGWVILLVTNLLKIDPICQALFDKTRDPENVRKTLENIYVNKDRVDDELVNGIVNPSKDDGAMKIFQSTYTGDPKPRPMDVLPQISQNVKIGAIWGKQDNVISPNMTFAQKVK